MSISLSCVYLYLSLYLYLVQIHLTGLLDPMELAGKLNRHVYINILLLGLVSLTTCLHRIIETKPQHWRTRKQYSTSNYATP